MITLDIHNHVLDNVDDGPNSFDESIAMIQQAIDKNVKTLYVTPHYQKFSYDLPLEKVEEKFQRLKQYVQKKKLAIELKLAYEVHCTPKTIYELEKGNILYLNDRFQRKYLLLELPSNYYPEYLDMIIRKCDEMNVTIILAHPERYDYFIKNIKLLEYLVSKGLLVQITVSALIGKSGWKSHFFCRKLMCSQMVHFIASDAHNTTKRPFLLSDGVKYLNKKRYNLKKLEEYNLIFE
ncbi:tyrosine-protein phosphatase [Enterococcus faecalis]|nr:CpsB/CapC family capsule biosynthesis tyrosine phosphatase [Enterococcus faecalis]